MFNEDSLRAEVVKVWGEHGAHIDVLDHIIKLARKAAAAEKAGYDLDPLVKERS